MTRDELRSFIRDALERFDDEPPRAAVELLGAASGKGKLQDVADSHPQ